MRRQPSLMRLLRLTEERQIVSGALVHAHDERVRAPVHAGGFCLAQASFHPFTATIVFPKESVTWRQVL